MRLTSRGWGLVVGAVGCGVAAALLGLPSLWVVAVAALFVVLIGVLTGRRRRGLSVDRADHLPTTSFGGDIDMHLTLHNGSRLPLGYTLLADTTPEQLHRDARATLEALEGHASVALGYRAAGSARGRHRFGPLQVRIVDPLGVAERSLTMPGTTTVVVLPRMVELPLGMGAESGNVPGDRGRGMPRPVGDDVGVVREYAVGDDLRRIHWPATAHRGSLMVRQAESRRHRRVVVLFDPTPGPDFETRVSAAASVGAHFDERGIEVHLVHDPHDLSTGRLPWMAQLERLAAVTPHAGDLTALTATLAGGAAGGGTLVVVATARDELAARLQRLGRSFDRRIAVVTATARRATDAETALVTARSLGWTAETVAELDDLPGAWQRLVRARRRVA